MPALVPALLVLLGALLPSWVEPVPSHEGSWPLLPRPQVVRGFEPPASRWGAGHRGVDLLGHAGQPVRAPLAGRVTFAARLAGRGVVVIDHGGRRTTYEPVTALLPVGTDVEKGQVVGTLQRTSSHCFPRACLHWGLVRGDTYLDPLTLVGAGPIRLLPWAGLLGAGLPGSRMPPPAPLVVPVAPTTVRLAGARAGRPGAAVPW